MIQFVCWSCGKSLKASPQHAGRKCKCSECNNVNTIPSRPDGQTDIDEQVQPIDHKAESESSPHLKNIPTAVQPPTSSDRVFCYKCGSSIFAEAEVCPHCGVRQRQQAARLSAKSFSDSISIGDGRNKVIAFLFAFFFGWLGAHKFYLGRISLGILYLLIGTVGGLAFIPFLFFLIWLAWLPAFIVAIISMIEGIMYLAMSDEEFAAKYR